MEIQNMDARCGNCTKSYKDHYLELGNVFCNGFTNGDIWQDEPTEEYISNKLFLNASEEQIEEIVQEWKVKNGHINQE